MDFLLGDTGFVFLAEETFPFDLANRNVSAPNELRAGIAPRDGSYDPLLKSPAMRSNESPPSFFRATAHAFQAAARMSLPCIPCFSRCALRNPSSAPERHRENVASNSGLMLTALDGELTGLAGPFSPLDPGGKNASRVFLYWSQSSALMTTAANSGLSFRVCSNCSGLSPLASKASLIARNSLQCVMSISISSSSCSALVTESSARRAARRALASTTCWSLPSKGAAYSNASSSTPNAARCSNTHIPGAFETTLGEAAVIVEVWRCIDERPRGA